MVLFSPFLGPLHFFIAWGTQEIVPKTSQSLAIISTVLTGAILMDRSNCEYSKRHFYFGRGRLGRASRHLEGHPIFSDKEHSCHPSSRALGSCWLLLSQHKWPCPPQTPKEARNTYFPVMYRPRAKGDLARERPRAQRAGHVLRGEDRPR